MKKCYASTEAVVLAEYDRLVAYELQRDPICFAFLPRGYYARKIAQNPEIPTSNESYIYKIIKLRYSK